MEEMQRALKSIDEKLTKRNDALEAMIITLNEKSETMSQKLRSLRERAHCMQSCCERRDVGGDTQT